jgi:hypothetical protein
MKISLANSPDLHLLEHEIVAHGLGAFYLLPKFLLALLALLLHALSVLLALAQLALHGLHGEPLRVLVIHLALLVNQQFRFLGGEI